MDVEKFLPIDALSLEDDEFMKLLDDLVDFDNINKSNNDNDIEEIESITTDESSSTGYSSESAVLIPAPNNILSRKPNNGKLSTNFTQALAKAINENDIRLVSQVIYDAMHSKCIFRIFDPTSKHKIELIGVDSVIGYFDHVLTTFPDGVCVLRKVKSTEDRLIRKTKSKICFAGTKVNDSINQFPTKEPHTSATDGCSMYVDEFCEQKEAIVQLEQQKILIHYFLKVGINTIIDRYINQIIVFEFQAKISSYVQSSVS